MASALPASIEAFLSEVGFSTTDLLVFRKLTEGHPLTLRELAVRTGKSTGVLDQSIKKFLQWRIAERVIFNGHPCYQLSSMQSLIERLRLETKRRQEDMDRRQKDLESYVTAVMTESARPDLQCYEGREGIVQAWKDLLKASSALQWCTITPLLHAPEDDPYREALVEIFRLRQARKVFLRVLAPDSKGARRSRFRDPFEFRQTLLMPPSELPIGLELTLADDFVLSIDRKRERACRVRYPEFAATHRAIFDVLWQRQLARERRDTTAEAPILHRESVSRPTQTRIASGVRSFLLRRRSIASLMALGVCAGMVTMLLVLEAI